MPLIPKVSTQQPELPDLTKSPPTYWHPSKKNPSKPQGYDSINSLEELVLNTHDILFDLRDKSDELNPLEANIGPISNVQNTNVKARGKTIERWVSLLPQNRTFELLAESLDQELQTFRNYFLTHMKGFPEKQFKVVLVKEDQNVLTLPYQDENGIVQIYLVNSSLRVERIREIKNFEIHHKITRNRNIIGAAPGDLVYKYENGNISKIYFTPKKVFVSPFWDLSREIRYETLVDIVLGEYLHSVININRTQRFDHMINALNSNGRFDNASIEYSKKLFQKLEEGAVHASVRLYLNLSNRFKPAVQALKLYYAKNKTYELVSHYLDAMKESTWDIKLKPVIPVHAFLSKDYDALKEGKSGLLNYAQNLLKKYLPKK